MTIAHKTNNFIFEHNLPGIGVSRYIVFILLTILFLVAILESPDSFPKLAKYTFVILLMTTFILVLWALWSSYEISFSEIKNIDKTISFFKPKILLGVAISVFFVTICFAVIYLGGINQSPFSDMLTISPVYFVAQFLKRDERKRYKKIITFWTKNKKRRKGDSISEELDKYLRNINRLNWVPVIIITLTVVVAEYFGSVLSMPDVIL